MYNRVQPRAATGQSAHARADPGSHVRSRATPDKRGTTRATACSRVHRRRSLHSPARHCTPRRPLVSDHVRPGRAGRGPRRHRRARPDAGRPGRHEDRHEDTTPPAGRSLRRLTVGRVRPWTPAERLGTATVSAGDAGRGSRAPAPNPPDRYSSLGESRLCGFTTRPRTRPGTGFCRSVQARATVRCLVLSERNTETEHFRGTRVARCSHVHRVAYGTRLARLAGDRRTSGGTPRSLTTEPTNAPDDGYVVTSAVATI